MPAQIKTRFLLLSDTHAALPAPEPDAATAYRAPLPDADVLIHAGDLTVRGHQDEYAAAFGVLAAARARLKLVIAGNHDSTLDRAHRRATTQRYEEARALWTGPEAKAAGIVFLDEGTHTFKLENGASLSVFASPYTPEFCSMGFPYERDQDRFNPAEKRLPNTTSTATPDSTIPDFPGVDVLITHGPPRDHLDGVVEANRMPVGCEALAHALPRCRPRMHVFGHIHEEWGAETVSWKADSHGQTQRLGPLKAPPDPHTIDASGIVKGEGTLLVNASIMTVRYKPLNAPFVVDLMLDAAEDDADGAEESVTAMSSWPARLV